jgi:hypothetical protein
MHALPAPPGGVEREFLEGLEGLEALELLEPLEPLEGGGRNRNGRIGSGVELVKG